MVVGFCSFEYVNRRGQQFTSHKTKRLPMPRVHDSHAQCVVFRSLMAYVRALRQAVLSLFACFVMEATIDQGGGAMLRCSGFVLGVLGRAVFLAGGFCLAGYDAVSGTFLRTSKK